MQTLLIMATMIGINDDIPDTVLVPRTVVVPKVVYEEKTVYDRYKVLLVPENELYKNLDLNQTGPSKSKVKIKVKRRFR